MLYKNGETRDLPQRHPASAEIVSQSSPFRIARDIERPDPRVQILSHVSKKEDRMTINKIFIS